MSSIKKFTYWECKLCECSWSGHCDLDEMRDHLETKHNFPGAWTLPDEEIQEIVHRRMAHWAIKQSKEKVSNVR